MVVQWAVDGTSENLNVWVYVGEYDEDVCIVYFQATVQKIA